MGICEKSDVINKVICPVSQKEINKQNNDNIQEKEKEKEKEEINKQNPTISNNNKETNQNIEKSKEKNETNEENKILDKDIKEPIKEKEKTEQTKEEKEDNQIQGNKTENEQKKEDEPKNEREPKKDEEPKKDVKKENEKGNESKEQSTQKNLEKNIITKDIIPRGLNNIGSTCYMNSVIQCLYHIFDLSNELMKLYKKNILNDTLLKKLPMTYEFLDVISELSFGKNNSISPYNFKEIIGNNKSFRDFEANDSKNLTLYILDTLNRELNEYKIKSENDKYISQILNYKEDDAKSIIKYFNENHNSLIGHLFNGLKSTNFICLHCKNCIKNYQIFNLFACNVEKAFMNKYKKSNNKYIELKIDVLDCFKVEEEQNLFNGDNQLFCEKCNKLTDSASFNKICISPKILILFLDRGINNRFNCEVDFPEELDINDFLEIKTNKYELIGTIEHLGPSGQSGHFIANCKHFDKNWYIFSDSSITSTKNKYIKYGIPYLVFYRLED